MDRVKFFKGYGKVGELEEAAFRRNSRKLKIILSLSLALLLVLIIGVVAGTLAHKNNTTNPGGVPAAIRSVCSVTHYPDSCFTSLGSSNSTNPAKIFQFSLTVVRDSLKKISTFPDEYMKKTDDPLVKEALKVCGTVLDDAADSLNDTMSASDGGGKLISGIDYLRKWLSTVVTDQETCLDALEEANGFTNVTFVGDIRLLMKNSTEFASNSLAIVSKILGALGSSKTPIHRRLSGSGFPAWVAVGERRLLQESKPKPDVTVAADGSGDVKTIGEAVARIPKKQATRFVIYVKAGKYVENVELDKSYWNVMMYGDGKTATIRVTC